MNALAYVQSQPWMILPEYLELIASIAARERSPEDIAKGIAAARDKREERDSSPAALAMREGEPLGDNKRVRVRDGVAIIEAVGPIVRYADFFSDISGATSTERLARDFNQALNSTSVNSILIFIDSPGGEAFGIGELAAAIADRANKKPVVAYVGGYGASAAYYIAAAADEVVIDPAAMLGSIGTVMEATDYSKAYEQRGIRKHQYVSQQSPNKRPALGTESGDAKMQKLVDDMAAVFVADVARFRGVSRETVLSDFGKGGLMVGKSAVKAGLADRIGSFEAVLAEMGAGKWKKKKRMAANAAAETDNQPPESGNGEEKTMSIKEKFFAWLDSVESPNATQQPTQQPPAPPAQTNQQHQQQQASANSDSEEVKQLRAQLEKEKMARLTTEAEGFINAKIAARTVLPSAKAGFVRDYVRAALDDEARPVASGEPSRVDALKAHFEGGKPHKLNIELVPSNLPKSAQVLDDNTDPEAREIAEDVDETRDWAKRQNRKQAS